MNETSTLLIYKKLNGNISEEELDALNIWLSDSEENFEYYQELVKVWKPRKRLNIQLSEKEVNDAWDTFVKTNNLAQTNINTEKRIRKSNSWLRIAASILLLVGIGWGTLSIYQNTGFKTVSTLVNTSKKVELPDGSYVWLNENTSIKYRKRFIKDRTIVLSGEAFFDVAKQNGAPFTVNAEDVQIVVLGTKFNVNKKEEITNVLVEEGKVSVMGYKTQKKVLLGGDEMASFNAGNQQFTKQELTDLNELFWKTKTLVFNDEYVPEVLKTISGVFKRKVVIEGKTLTECRFSGKYENANLEDVLEDLQDIFGCEISDANDTLQITGGNCY